MGRSRVPLQLSAGRPHGTRWTAYTKLLWAKWGPSPACFYCRDPVLLGEVAHLISPVIRPDLAWSPDNLVPAHGSGKRRCPDCHLNCNWLAHNSPDALKDEDGRDLPFTPEFMARQARENARFRAKRAGRPQFPANPPGANAGVTQATPRRGPGNVAPGTVPQDPGRDW